GLVLGHLGDEAAPAGVVDQGRCAPRCLLLVGLSLAGASALIDNARWCGFVAKMTEDEAKRLSDRAYDRQPIG
ncbi:helicase RepA family protein, partial [Aeromonas caviae]|uniref:helicase RepA family protein n=1 Tax=Aeromonas caviae TaxID=648 RepID=UPI001CC36CE4